MKAPDKIYLNRRHPEPYWFKDKQLDSDIEFIRKDALLEKIDEILNAKPDGGLAVDIAAQALVDIKKVINSM